MLSVAGEHLADLNPEVRLTMFGQELNDESYAICKADMLIKGQDVANIVAGNTLSDDGHPHKKFDYMLSVSRSTAEPHAPKQAVAANELVIKSGTCVKHEQRQ
jgi:hypothetical protein